MSKLNTIKQSSQLTPAEKQEAADNAIEQATANGEAKVVEINGVKYLEREINGFKVITKVSA